MHADAAGEEALSGEECLIEGRKGIVFLVGAGPGDPSLITCKALDCIRKADLIVYDHLIGPRLLRHAKENAEKIYVGKVAGEHTLPQGEINRLTAEAAAEGKIVCRLKGGDPFIFGRGGEEAEYLAGKGIPFEVVPGVTSAIAAPAYAGIPLTHRKVASSVAFITGNEDPTKPSSTIAWNKISTGADTLVFVMGVGDLPKIAGKLIEQGRDPETPVAIIEWGTLSRQRCVEGSLSAIAAIAEKKKVKPPAIIVMGEVVKLRERLAWFEKKPLFGRRVLVTRAERQAGSTVRMIEELGGEAIEFPTIRVEPPENFAEVDAAIASLSSYDWVVFTSVNGVEAFLSRMFDLGRDVRCLGGVRICSIGPRTTEALKKWHLVPDLQPEDFSSAGIMEAFRRVGDLVGKRVLLARSDLADKTLPSGLVSLGARVKEIVCYRTVKADPDPVAIKMLLDGEIDAVTFTSASTARNFAAVLGDDLEKIPASVAFASIGPVTAAAARKAGLTVHVEAAQHTIPHLIASLIAHFYSGSHVKKGQ